MIDLLPNETLPILWLIFMVVLVALNQLVFKPTLEIIEARKKSTEGLKQNDDALTDETRLMLSQYEERIAQGRFKAAKEREAIIAKAREKEQSIIQAARKENEALLEQMSSNIHQEKKEAELKLRQYAQELAKSMAEKVLERKVA
jgi:F0F1-type ATP synthase membrane subunit b/b'